MGSVKTKRSAGAIAPCIFHLCALPEGLGIAFAALRRSLNGERQNKRRPALRALLFYFLAFASRKREQKALK
jgi:hypothetical protein